MQVHHLRPAHCASPGSLQLLHRHQAALVALLEKFRLQLDQLSARHVLRDLIVPAQVLFPVRVMRVLTLLPRRQSAHHVFRARFRLTRQQTALAALLDIFNLQWVQAHVPHAWRDSTAQPRAYQMRRRLVVLVHFQMLLQSHAPIACWASIRRALHRRHALRAQQDFTVYRLAQPPAFHAPLGLHCRGWESLSPVVSFAKRLFSAPIWVGNMLSMPLGILLQFERADCSIRSLLSWKLRKLFFCKLFVMSSR